MRFFYTIVCLSLLVFNWHGAQVDALLNITEEALVTSRKLLNEIEGNSVITTEDELRKKLNIIKDIARDFERRYEYELREYYIDDWLDWFAGLRENRITKTPLTFKCILLRFKQLKYKISASRGIIKKYSNILANETTTIIINHPMDIFIYNFPEFAKNKYNLNVKNKIPWVASDYLYVQDVYEDLYQLFFYTDQESHVSIFEFLKNTTIYISESSFGAEFGSIPPQLRLFNTVKDLIVGEAFFFLRHQYYTALIKVYSEGTAFLKNEDLRALDLIKQYWGELNAFHLMKSYEEKFQLRSVDVYDKIRPALVSLSRRFSGSVPSDTLSYARLKVFTKYMINEVDLNADGSCKRTCSDYTQVDRIFGCFDGGICSVHKKCKGKLWDCEDIIEPMYICSWNNESIYEERYKFIKGNSYRSEVDTDYCPTEIKKAESWRRGFYKCSYCQCKCEETETHGNRYFSLRPSTSNIYDNYIVVGTRFETISNVVHLVATEGKLLPNGVVDLKTIRAVSAQGFNVTDYDVVAGKDFQRVTGDAKTVCFDELESPNDHLLTGLRLKFKDGYFKLEIRMTQFNYTTGELYAEKSVWYSKDSNLNQRPKINLDHFHKEPAGSIKSEGCVQFTTGRMEYYDIGQNTIPYIGTDVVRSYRIAPLSGAGMILKKGIDDEFIGFQLVTQDVTVYMQ